MHELIERKVAEFATDWMGERVKRGSVLDEQSGNPLENLEQNLNDAAPDFHDYLFARVEEYAASFNEYTRKYLFLLVFAALDKYATKGLVDWGSFRVCLTPSGEILFKRGDIMVV